MALTLAQVALVEVLIAEAGRGSDLVTARWPGAVAPRLAAIAREHHALLLYRDWCFDAVLCADGEVVILDTDGGNAPRPATTNERNLGLHQGLFKYPELHTLLPLRPADAQACPDCGGVGVISAVLQVPSLRAVICRCGGAGWLAGPNPPTPIPHGPGAA